ncbi:MULTISPECIES: TRAP transporter large permease [Variovorax]|jgi:TRAP-type mannitol/chloroaromatic compound transport system permease large subunit|uniref:TRAP transporter large permease n=1 Tax=Variovorax TaxID=34072 RepID=UPI00086E1AA0|nr:MULTISPECIES: TRAP transporter large permease subunit [Variovorax]MBN8755784.1 TRAP transporter large permease subunit [Variovorax sp.]ODU14691.1 MAG: C4-dicarboxylate ABC transporter [Variovorax sp. SCN 67-85]ODV23893.1 MAG: C4-dicarboxylate ABC transporter [Variovorax sp. SCN 67-20]OJZ03531.1 MAG: C4-dicarboxylate ABC transporter [Variovorax sp. 67-131]UKI07218.1 TRAP transporter large permease subunit [Variovorax paradoxus]
MIRRELWFGLSFMALIVIGAGAVLANAPTITNGHLGLLMLSLVVVAIMLGFPTAFTLMGMGMIFTWLAYDRDWNRTLDLMVQSAFKTMANDVLIAVPLFVFMGYLVERANLIESLFKSLHLALARLPGALAVATLVTCTIFATATGIVGAVVTLMGLLALPAMLRAGYSVPLAAGSITAGGCLGILLPPSVLLIVYGATAGVSVVQLYAGAFFPGLMLSSLYVLYVIIVAWLKPQWAPPLSQAERVVPLPPLSQRLADSPAAHALVGLLKGRRNAGVPFSHVLRQLGIVAMPGVIFLLLAAFSYKAVTTVEAQARYDIEEIGAVRSAPSEGGLQEPPSEGGLQEPPGGEQAPAPVASPAPLAEPAQATADTPEAATERPAPTWWWVSFAIFGALVTLFYLFLSFARLEIFKMLLASFFPLMLLIFSVLGSIVLGLATPTEAAAMGALGGMLLAAAYRRLNLAVLKESVFLTAKTSAMVCWLFVGSAIFSAAFALLGGQALVEEWVLGMNLTKVEFLILSQVIIFLLGWPLEWTEIIVIFMPIFIPLLDNFGVDPLFFGLLVALNLQTAFLSPPVAMAAFYLKGVSPPHVTLNQIFLGMLPFMGIQVLAIVLLYMWPQIGLWLPQLLYK